jgi:hypothetical protein
MLELALIAALSSCLISVFALVRTMRPPQTRHVLELTAQVAELHTGVMGLAAKVSKGNRSQQSERARAVLTEQRTEQADLVTQAAQILQKPAAPAPAAVDLNDKAALRRLAGLTH